MNPGPDSSTIFTAGLLAVCLSMAGCDGGTTTKTASWRADCPPIARPAPLSREAAREAHRVAAQRAELRMREAAAPGSASGAQIPLRTASGVR